MYLDPQTGEASGGIAKVGYSHDAMIDVMIAQPHLTQGQLASMFGYSQGWVSQIINSDAFRARLAERKEILVDPLILQSLDERLRGVAQRSLDRVLEALDTAKPEFALRAAQFSTEALGYGARPKAGEGGPQVAVVVNVPGQAVSAEAWVSSHRPATGVPIEPVAEAVVLSTLPPVDHETARTYP